MLALCGFGLGVELVLFSDTPYGTHTILQSGKEIGWSLHRGSQTIQVHPFVLTFYSLSEDEITDEHVCALVRELQVNQSHQKLE